MRESREKLQIFLINVLTLCSSKGEDKTHSFPKPPHSWSKSPKLSWADWNVASAGDTHHASEVSNLELLAVQPKHPDAPLSDTECHWQGFPGMGALGEHKAFQFLRSLLHPELFWTCSLRSRRAFPNQSILPSLTKPPPPKPLTTFPGSRNTAAFMDLCGWATGKLTECREPNTFFAVLSSFHWYSIKVY